MQKLENSRKVNTILKGNLRIYLSGDESQVRGQFDHSLTFSDGMEVDFVIGRKNNVGSWINEENAVNGLIGEFFEDGFTGSGEELVKEVNEKFSQKRETLLFQERQKAEETITKSFYALNTMMRKFIKAGAENCKMSMKKAESASLDNIYRNDLRYLSEEVTALLTDPERNDLRSLQAFFTVLEDSNNAESFQTLQAYCS